ncbi:MAG: MFS transporter, partial [Emcibacteraceae bacterium]|nr:MFS transporter [Emcibacteraceae bacterium]
MIKIILSITALLISIVTMQLANSMIAPTIVLRANAAGEGLTSIGLIPTVYGLGFVIGCFWARKLMKTIGHIRAFTVAGAILAALTLLMHLVSDPLYWIIFRGIMGCAIAIIMTCIDSWVGHVTPKEMRGRVIGFYSTVTMLAYVGAPALLSYSLMISKNAIIYAVLLFIVSLIPIGITKLPQPSIRPTVTTSFRALLKDVPSALVAAFVIGLTNTSVLNLLPVYGVKIGFVVSEALTLLVAVYFGGLLFQWPVGYLSDILGRRNVMGFGFLMSGVVSIAMITPYAGTTSNSIFLSFAWGGAALSLYAVALSHAIDHIDNEETVAVCATVLTTWSIGSIFGPMITGLLMEIYGVNALFLFCSFF